MADTSYYDNVIAVCRREIERIEKVIEAYDNEIIEYEDDFKIVSDQMEKLAELVIIGQSADASSVSLSSSMQRFEEHIKYLDDAPHSKETFYFDGLKDNNSAYNKTIQLNLDYVKYLKKTIGDALIAMEEEIAQKIGEIQGYIEDCNMEIGQYQRSINRAIDEKRIIEASGP